MFNTELESVENGFILKVRYNSSYKQWIYREMEDLIDQRARMEEMYLKGELETLEEEMK